MADASWLGESLTLRLEGVYALQQTSGEDLEKWGAYAMAAWRITRNLKPFLQLDALHIDETVTKALAGLVLIPFPEDARSAMLKVEGGQEFGGEAEQASMFVQLTVGF